MPKQDSQNGPRKKGKEKVIQPQLAPVPEPEITKNVESVDTPPRVFDVLAESASHIKTFEHFLKADKQNDEAESLRQRMRARRQDRVDIRRKYTEEKLIPMLGDIQKVDAHKYDSHMLRNKWTDSVDAFESTEGMQIYNSALTGRNALRYSKGRPVRSKAQEGENVLKEPTRLDTVIIVADGALQGIPDNFARHDLSKTVSDLSAVNSLLYGKNFGKNLKNGTFENCVIGGEGALTHSYNLTFKDTYIVTFHGTYFLKDVVMEGRFQLKDEYKVAA